MDFSWWTDFCLACDKQTDGSAYCSQTCRLADMDRSSSISEPSSPSFSSQPSLLQGFDTGARTGFYLPPAINFASYKATSATKSRPPKRSVSETAAAYEGFFDFSSTDSSRKVPTPSAGVLHGSALTPSSSHSSLVSLQSTSSQQTTLSEQARTELKDYASSFDQVRDLKRRMTTH